jgi:diacylglycerol kinase (ATP)
LKSIQHIRWLGGHLGYLAIVLKQIFSYRERQVAIRFGDEETSGKYLLMIVNNSSRTGGGFMVTPKASLTDGLLDVMLCEPLSLLKRLRNLPVIEKGKHLSLPFIKYRQVRNVEINANAVLFAQLDGELISAEKFIFSVLPGKLLVKF